jgi:hypothetical protein
VYISIKIAHVTDRISGDFKFKFTLEQAMKFQGGAEV